MSLFCLCNVCFWFLFLSLLPLRFAFVTINSDYFQSTEQNARIKQKKVWNEKWTNAINLIEKFQNKRKKNSEQQPPHAWDWWLLKWLFCRCCWLVTTFSLSLSGDCINNKTEVIIKNLFDFVFAFNLGSMPSNSKSNANKHSTSEKERDRWEIRINNKINWNPIQFIRIKYNRTLLKFENVYLSIVRSIVSDWSDVDAEKCFKLFNWDTETFAINLINQNQS